MFWVFNWFLSNSCSCAFALSWICILFCLCFSFVVACYSLFHELGEFFFGSVAPSFSYNNIVHDVYYLFFQWPRQVISIYFVLFFTSHFTVPSTFHVFRIFTCARALSSNSQQLTDYFHTIFVLLVIILFINILSAFTSIIGVVYYSFSSHHMIFFSYVYYTISLFAKNALH